MGNSKKSKEELFSKITGRNLKYDGRYGKSEDDKNETTAKIGKSELFNRINAGDTGTYRTNAGKSAWHDAKGNNLYEQWQEKNRKALEGALDIAATGGANIRTTPYEIATGSVDPMRYVAASANSSVKNSFKADTKTPYKRTGIDIDQNVIDDVNGMIKERSVGQKIGDFLKGNNGYTDRYTGEHVSSGKEARITEYLKEKYGMTDEAALQISKNWGTIQADQEKENAQNWYNEREKEYNALPEDIKERLEGFYYQSKSPEAFMLNAEIEALENQGYDARNLYEYVKRKNEIKENKDMQKSVEEAGKVKNFAQNILATGATIGQFNDALEQLGYTFSDIPYDTSAAQFTNYKDAVRGETTGRIDNKVGQKAYQIGTSMADSALAMGLGALTGTEAVSLATMSAGAAASAYNDATERGLSKGKAAGTAMANGVFEALFEKVSLDHFLKLARTEGKVGVKNAVKDILMQSGVEGSEEVFTSIADEIADQMINTDMSNYNMKVEEYMRNGMTAEKAQKKANGEFALQLADDFVSGAVSGLGFGAVAKGISNHKYRKGTSNMSSETIDSLYETAKNAPENSTAHEITESVAKEELTARDKAQMVESLDGLRTEDAKNAFKDKVAEETSPEAAETATKYFEQLQEGKISEEEFAKDITNNVANNSQERTAILDAASQNTQIEETMQQIQQENYGVERMSQLFEDKSTQKAYKENYANSGLDLQEYTSTFNRVLNSAKSGYTLEEFTKQNPIMAHSINPESLVKMYSHAENLAEDTIKAYTNKAQREVATSWAKELGVNLEFVDNPKENGHYENGTIYISNQTINPMGVVFAHEFTHYLSENHTDLYSSLKAQAVDFFKDTETGNGLYEEMRNDIMSRYADEIKAWEQNGKLDANIDEEITAHMTEAVMEHLANMSEKEQRSFADDMYKRDRNLFEKFVDFLKAALEKIKKTLSGYHAESVEAKAVQQYQKQLEALTRTFTEANAEVKRRNSNKEEEKTRKSQEEAPKKSKKVGIENEIKDWYNTTSREQRAKEGGFFTVGTTSEALKSIGLETKEIRFGKSKIQRILDEHAEMTIELISHAPETLENPIVVMSSITQKDSLVILGEDRTQGKGVIVTIKVSNGNAEVYDYIITGTHGRGVESLQNMLNKAVIYYVDPQKNRTDITLSALGVQFPSATMKYGSIRKVPQHMQDVNNKMKSTKNVVSDSQYDELKKHFGTTDNFDVAGYMLKDGTMLDFSGKHWGSPTSDMRQVDHREVDEVLEDLEGNEAMTAMIQSGSMRLSPEDGGINLAQKPTDKQYRTLEKYIKHFKGEVIVDFDDADGKTVKSVNFEKGTSAAEIFDKIDDFFENPNAYKSPLSDFMYSTKNLGEDADFDAINRQTRAESILEEGFKALNGKTISDPDIRAIARKLIAQEKSKYDVKRFESNLVSLFAYINENKDANFKDLMRITHELAAPVVKESNIYQAEPATERTFNLALRIYQEYFKKAGADEVNGKIDKAVNEVKARYENRIKNARERKAESDLRKSIYTKKARLDRMITRPTKGSHIPANMLQAAVEIADAINTTNDRSTFKAVEEYKKLKEAYNELKFDENFQYAHDQTVSFMIKDMQDIFETKRVVDLNRQELETVDRILNAIVTQVSNENTLVSEKRSESIYELSEQAKKEVRASRGFNDRSTVSRMLNSYQSMALNFSRLMDRTFGYEDDSVGKTLTKLMEDGEIRKLSFERDVDYLFDDVIGGNTKAERKKIREERLQFEGKNKKGNVDTNTWVTLPSYRGGNSAKVPASMRMSLIMHLMNEDNIRHIAYGGFNIPNLTEYERGNIKAAYDRGTIYKIPFFDDEEVKEYQKKAESFESWDGEYRVNKSNPLYIAYQEAKAAVDNLRKSNYKDAASYEIAKKELTEKREAAWKAYQDGREDAYRGLNRLLKQRVDEYLDKLTRNLTDYEKKFLADSKEFFWNMSGDRINEVTMKLYGYEKANVKHYFPINVDSNSIVTDDPQVKFDGTLEGSGFLKNRIHSRKPILVEDITKVVKRQTNRVSQFYGFATAVRDAKAVLGYNADGTSLRSEIMHKWGSGGEYTTAPMNMIDKTISDIETGGEKLRNDVIGRLFRKASSNYAGAVLTGNFGVTIKQAASAPNAAAVVGWKNLNIAMSQNPFFAVHNPEAVAEIEKRTPLMRYREKGYAIPEIGDALASKEYGTPVGFFTGMITGMDVRTVRMLEYAAVAWGDNDSGLTKGSEQYWDAVTDKFNEIVRKTQPNYTMLERPEFLRSQNMLWRTLFMFKTQPVQNYGMLYDAVGNYAAKKAKYGKGSKQVKEASLNLARAVTSNLASQAVYALMSLASKLFYHSVKDLLPDKDEDGNIETKLDWNKVGGYLVETFLSSEAGMIAGGSELFEYLSSKITGKTYYGVSDSITSSLNDVTDGIDRFTNAIEKLADAKTEEQQDKAMISLKYSARSLGTRIGVLLGVPVNNIYKPLNSMISYAQDIKNKDLWSGKGVLQGDTSEVQSQYDRIFEAVEKNNMKRAKELQQQLIEDSEADDPEDSVENNIKRKIGEEYKKKEMSEANARKNLSFVESDKEKIDEKIENWDLAVIKKDIPEEYTVDQLAEEVNKSFDEKKAKSAITSEIKSQFKDGKLSDKEAMKYLENYNYVEDEDEAWFEIESWKYDSKYGRYYDELASMIETGSTNRKKLVDICNEYKKHGAEKKNIAAAMASKYKDKYLEATGSEKAALNSCLLNALYAAGYSSADARARLKGWTEKKDK